MKQIETKSTGTERIMNLSSSKWRRPGREALLLLYWIPHFIWFELITYLTPRMNPHVIYSPTDDWIPFLEVFILPYVLWYFYIAAVPVSYTHLDVYKRQAYIRSLRPPT